MEALTAVGLCSWAAAGGSLPLPPSETALGAPTEVQDLWMIDLIDTQWFNAGDKNLLLWFDFSLHASWHIWEKMLLTGVSLASFPGCTMLVPTDVPS